MEKKTAAMMEFDDTVIDLLSSGVSKTELIMIILEM